MKKVKGLVLKQDASYVYLLTPDGEYLKTLHKNRSFEIGSEAEFDISRPAGFARYAAIAALFVVIVFSLSLYLTMPRESAYLVVDINPGVLITLDQHALVLNAVATNSDGEELLSFLVLERITAESAIKVLLEQAYLYGYLKADIDNAVYISLASPDNYLIGADQVRRAANDQIAELGVNSYLKVQTLQMERATIAVRNRVSLNSIALKDDLIERGKWNESLDRDWGNSPNPGVGAIQERAGSEVVFRESEYIAGQKAAGERPDHAGPAEESPGPEREEPPRQQQSVEQHSGPGEFQAEDLKGTGDDNRGKQGPDNGTPGRNKVH